MRSPGKIIGKDGRLCLSLVQENVEQGEARWLKNMMWVF